MDIGRVWKKLSKKAKSRKEGLELIYKKVGEAVEVLVGKLEGAEVKKIHTALAGRRRLNRAFDLLGIGYPDWPVPAGPADEGGSKKRKRADAVDKAAGGSKRGCGRGRGQTKKLASKVRSVGDASIGPSTSTDPVSSGHGGGTGARLLFRPCWWAMIRFCSWAGSAV